MTAASSPPPASRRGVRSLARERALQVLYAAEFAAPDEPFEIVERRFLAAEPSHRRGWGPFAKALATATHGRRSELDAAIEPLLRHWTLQRLPIVERCCLRMALCELRHFDEIPMRVTINEYLELARRYSGDEATQYINAVLDRLARDCPAKVAAAEADRPDAPSPPPPDGADATSTESPDDHADPAGR